MNDDKTHANDPNGPPPRTPNRSSSRTPPMIEGEAVRASENAPETATVSTDEAASAPSAPSGLSPEPAEPVAAHSGPAAGAPEPETPSAEPAASGSITSEGPGAAAAAAQTDARPEPDSRRRGFGFGAVAATSLASAGLAALAVFGLQTATAPEEAPVAALEKRLGEVEQRAAASAQAPQVAPDTITALEKRIASAEALASNAAEIARKAAQSAAPPPPGAEGGASQEDVRALEQRLAALEKNASGAVSTLSERLAAVEKALAAPKTDERATEEPVIRQRLEPAPPPDLEPLRDRIAALEQRLQSVEQQTAPLSEAARAAGGQISALQDRIQPLAARVDEARALAQSERKRAEDLAERSAEAARLALAQSIAAAVESGQPFAAQVNALERLGAPAERLGALREASQTGVATEGELARSFAALEPKILTRPQPSSDASIVDRLTSSALGLVRVTPAGEPTGDAPADIFARILRALQRGDVAGALKLREKLPDDAKAASAEWAQRARARVEAEQAARAILSDSTQKLGRS